MPDPNTNLAQLEAYGLLQREGNDYRTTRRWQAAMARAAFNLLGAGDASDDLRTPVAYALVELYGSELTDERLTELVLLMTRVEARELDPQILRERAHTEKATAFP